MNTTYKQDPNIIYYTLTRKEKDFYVFTFDFNKHKEKLIREEIRKRLQG
jgi:hypothetical protein